MKTVLYNVNEGRVLMECENGFYIDGVKPQLPQDIVELELIEEDVQFDPMTQEMKPDYEYIVRLDEGKVIKRHVVENLPQHIIMRKQKGWLYDDYSLRIIAPVSLVFDPIGIAMKVWFDLNEMPVKKVGNHVHLYCNYILPDHQDIIDQYAEIIMVEERPDPLPQT